MKKIFLILLPFSLLIAGCDNKSDDSPYYNFLEQVSEKKLLQDNRVVIIIPGAGCSGCIMASEKFMFDNIDKLDSTVFILTSFNSVKELKVKYSETDPFLLRNEKVILDTNKEFDKMDIDKRYPIVIFIKDSKILNVEQLDVENQTLLSKIKSV